MTVHAETTTRIKLPRAGRARALEAAAEDAYQRDVIDTDMESNLIGKGLDYASKEEWIESKLDEWFAPEVKR